MKMEWLTGRNGLQVPGWNGIDGEKIVVIMAHGFGSAKEGFTPKFMNLGLKKAGIGFYGFDFPAHGDSPIDGDGLTVQRCIDSYQAAEQRAIERRDLLLWLQLWRVHDRALPGGGGTQGQQGVPALGGH